jgi:hypothetical protein
MRNGILARNSIYQTMVCWKSLFRLGISINLKNSFANLSAH